MIRVLKLSVVISLFLTQTIYAGITRAEPRSTFNNSYIENEYLNLIALLNNVFPSLFKSKNCPKYNYSIDSTNGCEDLFARAVSSHVSNDPTGTADIRANKNLDVAVINFENEMLPNFSVFFSNILKKENIEGSSDKDEVNEFNKIVNELFDRSYSITEKADCISKFMFKRAIQVFQPVSCLQGKDPSLVEKLSWNSLFLVSTRKFSNEFQNNFGSNQKQGAELNSVFNQVKGIAANYFANSLPSGDALNIIHNQLGTIKFNQSGCKDSYYAWKIQAFYTPKEHEVSICPLLLLNNSSRFELVQTMAHEIAHSIDPCTMLKHKKSPYDKLLTCMGEQKLTYSSNGNCVRNKNEAFCDFVASKILGIYFSDKKYENFSNIDFQNGYANSLKGIIYKEDVDGDESIYNEGTHPSARKRYEILMSDPTIRRQMGCDDEIYQKTNCFFK